MEENDHKRHFSLKKIMQEENMSEKKKRRKKRKKLEDDNVDMRPDDFKINVDDDRFSALFTSHKYNVDPSDPNYKKTKAMETIISEKQKRRATADIDVRNIKHVWVYCYCYCIVILLRKFKNPYGFYELYVEDGKT